MDKVTEDTANMLRLLEIERGTLQFVQKIISNAMKNYAQEYFSSHFVEAVIKCIPGGPYWDVNDKILSAFNKLILENAERLVNEKQ